MTKSKIPNVPVWAPGRPARMGGVCLNPPQVNRAVAVVQSHKDGYLFSGVPDGPVAEGDQVTLVNEWCEW